MAIAHLRKLTLVALASPSVCVLLTYIVGSIFAFDGQAAILTLPFVLLGWTSLIVSIPMGAYMAVSSKEPVLTRMICVVGVLANCLGLAVVLLLADQRKLRHASLLPSETRCEIHLKSESGQLIEAGLVATLAA